MHHPATVEAAPITEKEGSVPTRLANHTLLLQGRRYILKREISARQSTGGAQTASLAKTTGDFGMYNSHHFDKGWPHGPRGRLR